MPKFKRHNETEKKKKTYSNKKIKCAEQDAIFMMFGSIHKPITLTNEQMDKIIYETK